MKSIHLSRVTDDSFATELKNEISILKALDHPHIVRAMETFGTYPPNMLETKS
jgi:serine/threonine protein kinase